MRYTPKPAKWCSHCEKSNHNDDECWSTRSIPVQQYMPVPVQPAMYDEAVERGLIDPKDKTHFYRWVSWKTRRTGAPE